jgi:hypothetical protein
MSQRRSKTLTTTQIAADRTTLRALKLLPDYAPLNQAYSTNALLTLDQQLNQAEEREFQLETALAAARASRAELSTMLHQGVIGAKIAVISQYGHNSDAVASLGLKKKSEYRRPARRTAKDDA